MPRLIPNLWFDRQGLEAAEFWCSIFPNSKIVNVIRYPDNAPDRAGEILTVDFELDGQLHTAINGGPQFTFDPAVSLLVDAKDQDEIDHYTAKLIEGGGEQGHCGWLTDKFGFSWQVCPQDVVDYYKDPADPKTQAAVAEMMTQMKIDLAAIQQAYDSA